MLEVRAVDGGEYPGRHFISRSQGSVVVGGVVVGLVPDLGVDGSGQDEPDVDTGIDQVGGQRLTPSGEGELGGAVGRFVGDPEPTAEARDVDDGARPALEEPGEQGHGDGHRRQIVDHHGPFDFGHGEALHRPPQGDTGVVDDHVDRPDLVPDGQGQFASRAGIGQVGRPPTRVWGTPAALLGNLLEPVGPTGYEGHGGPLRGEHARRCGSDA